MNGTSPEDANAIARLKVALTAASFLAVVALVAAVLIYQRFSTLRPLVTVGDRTISKREYEAVLDQTAGKQVLTKLVLGELVRQAAARAHLLPAPKDVDARLALLQSRNPALAQSVAASGQAAELRQGVLTDLALENLRIRGLAATDAEVSRYYAAHQSLFRQQGHAQVALFVTNSSTDAQSAAKMLNEGMDPSVIGDQPEFHQVGRDGYSLPANAHQQQQVLQAMKTMKSGEVRIMLLTGQYLTIKIISLQPAGLLPLSKVRDQVARLVKLQKAPSVPVELAVLYKAQPPTFAINKYADYFSDVEQVNTSKVGSKVAALR